MIGEAMLIVWKSMGVTVDKVDETDEKLTMYISVPKTSYHTDAKGNEMSGMFLAKRIKKTLTEMGVKRLEVRCKVRDEDWTKEKAGAAELDMRKTLFGSQH